MSSTQVTASVSFCPMPDPWLNSGNRKMQTEDKGQAAIIACFLPVTEIYPIAILMPYSVMCMFVGGHLGRGTTFCFHISESSVRTVSSTVVRLPKLLGLTV